MYAAGFRPGFDPLVKAAVYAFNATTRAKLWRTQEDLTHQGNLPAIEDFFAERFVNLSSYTFESNTEIASHTGAPFHIEHHTSNSETYNAWNVRVVPSRGKITRFGCACQINQTLVDIINQVNEMCVDMNDEEWAIFVELF
ncbi:uncharacterized protein MELLADRAFT_108832 [Melampsora larici-populina 98AG31]|uniref:Tet-like 2OG-Fe(II) oxygenase domain-containing protein n=1 Tax=Melampsora larici-populina (strain 98AG31 / pathotype 3-4-7) TaxID=747676 RepID=F4RUF0_MELLP|nr:uncharacterized protein MELLADRAFT_108832 [Melampsora larici-populina 98AG31]EGG03923.1 hypothetical protein MELLADRAFT_108832 [Melampsora larici-populina 98AG31]